MQIAISGCPDEILSGHKSKVVDRDFETVPRKVDKRSLNSEDQPRSSLIHWSRFGM